MLVTCNLADFAIYPSVWEWVYSLNRRTVLCIKVVKVDFLKKNLLLWGKLPPQGKFAEGKISNIGVTLLVKETCKD